MYLLVPPSLPHSKWGAVLATTAVPTQGHVPGLKCNTTCNNDHRCNFVGKCVSSSPQKCFISKKTDKPICFVSVPFTKPGRATALMNSSSKFSGITNSTSLTKAKQAPCTKFSSTTCTTAINETSTIKKHDLPGRTE